MFHQNSANQARLHDSDMPIRPLASLGVAPSKLTPLPPDWTPLAEESRTHVSTAVLCAHLNRKPQTARIWACRENGPLRPLRVNGRLAWPVAEIRKLLGVAA